MDVYLGDEDYLDALKVNFQPKDGGDWLFWKPPGKPIRLLYCKPSSFKYTVDRKRVAGSSVQAQLVFHADDPRWYGDVHYDIVGFPGISLTGRDYPKTYPYVYGDYHFGGEVEVVNEGTLFSGLTFSFSGIITNPVIFNQTTNQTMFLDVAMHPGDTLQVDTINRVIYYNGANYGKAFRIGSEWVGMAKGNNRFLFSATSTGDGAQVVVATRNAWV
jgi:hypothetical protein